MFDYFLTNISISFIALCVLIILKDSPARLRFLCGYDGLVYLVYTLECNRHNPHHGGVDKSAHRWRF